MYRFGTQKHKGAAVEQLLDAWFGQICTVRLATPAQQMAGIDRLFSFNGKQVTVEYKADWTAGTTGNAFIEVKCGERPGWALKSEANVILYYVPQARIAYLLAPDQLRSWLTTRWLGYPRRIVHNPTYIATGILVPLSELTDTIRIN